MNLISAEVEQDDGLRSKVALRADLSWHRRTAEREAVNAESEYQPVKNWAG